MTRSICQSREPSTLFTVLLIIWQEVRSTPFLSISPHHHSKSIASFHAGSFLLLSDNRSHKAPLVVRRQKEHSNFIRFSEGLNLIRLFVYRKTREQNADRACSVATSDLPLFTGSRGSEHLASSLNTCDQSVDEITMPSWAFFHILLSRCENASTAYAELYCHLTI